MRPSIPAILLGLLTLAPAGRDACAEDALPPALAYVLEMQEWTAQNLERQGLYEEAAGLYRNCLRRIDEAVGKAPSPALLRRAHRLAYRLGDYASAARYSEALLSDASAEEDRDWALEQTAVCLTRLGDWAALAALGERRLPTLPAGPRRAWLQIVTSRAYARQGQPDRAEALYKRILEEDPRSPAAALAQRRLVGLRVASELMGRISEMAGPADADPVDPRVLSAALSCLMERGDAGVRCFTIQYGKGKVPAVGNVQVSLQRPGDAAAREMAFARVGDLRAQAPELAALYQVQARVQAQQEATPSAHRPGRIGVEVRALTPDVAAVLGLAPGTPGVLVAGVAPGSPAEAAGLSLGDVILCVNDVPVDLCSIRATVRTIPAGGDARVMIVRAHPGRVVLPLRAGQAP